MLRNEGHQAKGVATDIEPAAIKPRPCCYAYADKPLFEAGVTEFSIRSIDRVGAAIARVELPQQILDDRSFILLHQIPKHHVNRHATSLNQRDRFGAVVGPVQHPWDIACGKPRLSAQLPTQQFSGFVYIFFTIFEDALFTVLSPPTLTDILCHYLLLDVLPTLNSIRSAGIGQALAWPLAGFVRLVREEDIAGREIGRVQIVNVNWEAPTKHRETGQLGPRGIGDE
jgi:hypothetical protein